MNNAQIAYRKIINFMELNDLEYNHVQFFHTRNIAGDRLETIYHCDGLMIDYCEDYGYFEVFGLTDNQFKQMYYLIEEYFEEDEKEYDNDVDEHAIEEMRLRFHGIEI